MPAIYLKSVALVSDAAPGTNGAGPDVPAIVKGVIDAVRARGDEAVREFSVKFDKWSPKLFKLSQQEIDDVIAQVPAQTLADIKEVQRNVRAFAEAQRASIKDFEVEIRPGVHLGQKSLPISTVGCYIPGGRYPLLASAHMTILTAKVAGVKHVIGCTPPIGGVLPYATIAAMHYAGADEIFVLGGVQAVAAMAVGTETIRKVDFIAGPGNAFVAEGKRQLFGAIGIDLFAGPTEVLIVADEHADPFMCASALSFHWVFEPIRLMFSSSPPVADLLSQAEHGPDTPAVLITTSEAVGRATIASIEEQLKTLSTHVLARTSWEAFGEVIVVDTLDEAFELADTYASEHVQILTQEPREALTKMSHYGALFLGQRTCVSFGDKVIGTNHVLPTRKAARYTGGLWVGKFLRTCTYQEVSTDEASGELGRLCGRAARAETFEGHARSGQLRASRFLGDHYDWIDSPATL